MSEESAELCGIPGGEDEQITKGEFNRLAAQIRFYHFRPIRMELAELKEMVEASNIIMQTHIESDREFFAKLAGAKWALYAIAAILAPLLPIMYYLIKALTTSGVL